MQRIIIALLVIVAVSASAAAARITFPTHLAAKHWAKQNAKANPIKADPTPLMKSLAARRLQAKTGTARSPAAELAAINAATAKSKASASPKSPTAAKAGLRDPGVPSAPYGFNTYWFTQTLDHFSFASAATFQQKYLVNDTWWDGNGPIFFYTGNEGPIELFAQNTGFMWEVAAEFNALVVLTEHRYYGDSLPFGYPDSFLAVNLQYLTSEQALADYAVFLSWFKASYGLDEDTRVVAFGGSYGGMLAAWMRIKYPHIIAGSIAASAPILQFQDSVSYFAFNEIVTADFAAASPQCADGISQSWAAMRALNVSQINKLFSFCPGGYTDPAHLEDTVFAFISGALTYMAMVDYPYPTTFLGPMPGYPVEQACTYFKTADSQLDGLVQAIGVFYNWTGEAGSCYNLTAGSDGPSTLADPGGWAYQQCTEMWMPMSQDNVHDFFWPSLWDNSYQVALCVNKTGYAPRPKWVLEHYGGIFGAGGVDMAASSNIVFSNGQLDPWNAGGVLSNLSVESNLIAIQYYGAHHLDLRAAMPEYDPQSVVDARNIERYYIKVFLGQYPSTQPFNNKQVAGLTIFVTLIVTVVGYMWWQSYEADQRKPKPAEEPRSGDYPSAVVHHNADRSGSDSKSSSASGGGKSAQAIVFDSPHRTPILPAAGVGPLTLNH